MKMRVMTSDYPYIGIKRNNNACNNGQSDGAVLVDWARQVISASERADLVAAGNTTAISDTLHYVVRSGLAGSRRSRAMSLALLPLWNQVRGDGVTLGVARHVFIADKHFLDELS